MNYLEFFKQELTDNLLWFWMDRCLDKKNGGYLNCFTNEGDKLISKDKYTWSQGRFLWMFSRLATIKSDLFDEKQRQVFLDYAKNGRDFLMAHALIAPGDYRCAFLLDAKGNPKTVGDHEGYDLSISADCFVVMGFAAYAKATGDREAWEFAKNLGESVWVRYRSDNYRSLPYPVTKDYMPHAKPMILTNVCCELYKAATEFDPDYAETLKGYIRICHKEVFEEFLDEKNLVHEFKYSDGRFARNLLGQQINPGHTLEDMWFQLEAAEITGCREHLEKIGPIVKATMAIGWDEELGGLFHFIPSDGLSTRFYVADAKDEPQMKLMLDDFASKLWWVHSEAMYTTMLMYKRTGDAEFKDLFDKVFDYTYKTFPNPDRNIREWIQIRTRTGKPQDKVVALPVKDPYHIIRNVLMLIELLEEQP